MLWVLAPSEGALKEDVEGLKVKVEKYFP